MTLVVTAKEKAMDRTDKRALVLALVDALRTAGSWCGETHIQKTCYVLQTSLNLPTDFEFVLYKHGPFSFGLQEYIGELRGDDLLAAVPTDFPYGTSLAVTPQGKQIEALRKDLVAKYSKQLTLISERLGRKGVKDLEKIATAIFVTKELGADATLQDRAKLITEYKKHLSMTEAEQAINEADSLLAS
jgi:hypothetical protein